MSEVLEKAAADSLQQVTNYLTRSAEFAISQAPDVAREAILWGRIGAVTEACLSVGFALIVVSAQRKAKRVREKNKERYMNDEHWLWYAVATVGAFMSFVFLLSALDGAKAWIAPKLYLVQEFLK